VTHCLLALSLRVPIYRDMAISTASSGNRLLLFVIASPDLSGRGNLGWGWWKQATFICHCETFLSCHCESRLVGAWQSRPGSGLSESDYRAAELASGCFLSRREYQVTIWLIEYNFNRPHQSLGYLAPIEYIERELAKICSPVLPLWSASTVF